MHTRTRNTDYDNTTTATSFHPLLSMIASTTNNDPANYVKYVKEENEILRARIPGQIHTRPVERARLLNLGQVIGRSIEQLMTTVSPAAFYALSRIEIHRLATLEL